MISGPCNASWCGWPARRGLDYMRSDTEFRLAVARATRPSASWSGDGEPYPLTTSSACPRRTHGTAASPTSTATILRRGRAGRRGATDAMARASPGPERRRPADPRGDTAGGAARWLIPSVWKEDAMKALLAPLACRIGDVEGNTARAIEAIRSRIRRSEIAVFPELYLLRLHLPRPRRARPRPAPADHGGSQRRRPDGDSGHDRLAERTSKASRSSAACIDDDGTLAASPQVPISSSPRAEAEFVEGEEQLIVELAGRRAAPLICFDIGVPGARAAGRARRRRPARDGVRDIDRSTSTMPSGRSPGRREPSPAPVRRSRRERRRARLRRRQQVDQLHRRDVLAEAGRDREELLIVSVADFGGFDPRRLPRGSCVLPGPSRVPREGARRR